ncbi:hypothetical protein WR25_17970 [Diploscapter pachys]|uniref:small monomeric GTPase n=1 Tax=Diploscapter pachys TaxID=2018661 RepID=A0A2A2LCC9_9BILA|nr:hypothetical protein WR25_17970 [Diploscapter pachys]
MRSTAPLREMHIAIVGMTGSGKSALAVRYITKRFISEYDSTLEDTYCRTDSLNGQPLMVWMMDTVEDSSRDDVRWIAWADIYLVVYDITSQLSLQYAEGILERIQRHEHLLCAREHKLILVGNKNDLERYRQVSEAEGEAVAVKHKSQFAELSAAGDIRPLSQLLHATFQENPPRSCALPVDLRKFAPRHRRRQNQARPCNCIKLQISKMALNPKMRRMQREDSKLDAMLKGVATGKKIDRKLTSKVDLMLKEQIVFTKATVVHNLADEYEKSGYRILDPRDEEEAGRRFEKRMKIWKMAQLKSNNKVQKNLGKFSKIVKSKKPKVQRRRPNKKIEE